MHFSLTLMGFESLFGQKQRFFHLSELFLHVVWIVHGACDVNELLNVQRLWVAADVF